MFRIIFLQNNSHIYLISIRKTTKQGFIFLNGVNLGRYWPLAGPQITLYVPKEILRKLGNTIVVVELQRAPKSGAIQFSDKPIYINRN